MMKRLVPILLLAVAACGGTQTVTGTTSAPAAERRESVVFEVGGDIDFASYDDEFQSGIQYPAGVTRIELTGKDVPQLPKPLYTWANSSGGRDAKAWCRITVNGQAVMEKHTEGDANDPTCLLVPPLN